jgi:hypothetical protein
MQGVTLWKRAHVVLSIKNRVIGGTPTDPKLIEGWLTKNMPAVKAEERKALAEKTLEQVKDATDEFAGGMWTTFKKDELGPYIESRQIKAMFKESANVLREILIRNEKKSGTKSRFTNLKSRVAERLFLEHDCIYFNRDDAVLSRVDGNEERAISVMTAQGPRSALKRYDFIAAPATVEFTLRWLDDGVVDLELIKTLLEHASWNGMGADRSQGNGLFEIDSIEMLGSKPNE